jgi:excisionase family DNA binding protein
MSATQPVYLTVKEVADRLGCDRTTVKAMIERGELPALDMTVMGGRGPTPGRNRHYRIHPNDLEALTPGSTDKSVTLEREAGHDLPGDHPRHPAHLRVGRLIRINPADIAIFKSKE